MLVSGENMLLFPSVPVVLLRPHRWSLPLELTFNACMTSFTSS
jgi:hypothetical protein